MADERRPGGGEPTEPPSERKLRRARQQGDVARSAEVVSAAVFVAGAAAIAASWPAMIASLRQSTRELLLGAVSQQIAPGVALRQGLSTLITVLWPLLTAVALAALLGNLAQVGPLLTTGPLRPRLQRLDLLQNARRLLGGRAGAELLKAVLKIGVIAAIARGVLDDYLPRLLALAGRAPEQAVEVVADCLAALALRLGIFFVVLAAADWLYQRRSYLRRQRMTREEVRREQKEGEGDPQHKAERQRLHRELLEHQMLEAVRHADCVIVNPTRLAVALRYDPGAMAAPRVVARGRRQTARKMREIARQAGVPVVRDVPLARALVALEIDQEIPEALYQAVAEVLRFVQQLEGRGEDLRR